jgi:hypothetical protein
MIKVVIFMKKKPELSRAQLIDYYENSHVPLIMKHTGSYMLDYRRSYPDWDNPISFSKNFDFNDDMTPEHDFDVITEMWVKDRATLDEMFAAAGTPELVALIQADADQFRIQSSVRTVITDEYGIAG